MPQRVTDLPLTEEQAMLLETVHRFVEERVAPAARDSDRQGVLPGALRTEMAEMGLFSLPVPEAAGGAGMGWRDHGLVVQALAEGSGSAAMALLAQVSLAACALMEAGGAGHGKLWLPRLAAGETAGTAVLSGVRAAATPGGGARLSGRSRLVPGAAEAGLLVVAAREEGGDGGDGGDGGAWSLWVAERGTKGLAVGEREEMLGLRAAGFADVAFEECDLPPESLLAGGEAAAAALGRVLACARLGVASLCLGLAGRALDLSVRYAGERVAFGKPLAALQAVAGKVADMKLKLEAARHLAAHGLSSLDARSEGAVVDAVLAKAAAAECAVFCGDEAIQIHGGYGFTSEYHVERIYRDANVCEVLDERSDLLKLEVARGLLE